MQRIDLPHPEVFVVPGVRWGRPDEFFTPAFWSCQHHLVEQSGLYQQHRLGRTFREEVVACLLGGHGIPAEMGIAAFKKLQETCIFECTAVDEEDLYEILGSPIQFSGKKTRRYRFARQKSKYIAMFLNDFQDGEPTLSGIALRDWLTTFPGIGLKTASWVVRNWEDSDEVAILDIHVYRAGLLAGFFSAMDCIAKHYTSMEQRFLKFAEGIRVRPSVLDALIWQQMRLAGRLAIRLVPA